MSNNLKVNAKTKPLELKKKHNLLVEKVEDVEEEIPSSQAITNLAKAAIQADKEILDLIEYDYEGGTITFPEFILPLRINIQGNDYFFDYNNNYIVNSSNVDVGEISQDENKLIIVFTDGNDENIDTLDYIMNIGGYDKLNSYYLYNPLTSAGTKLYKHSALLDSSVAWQSIELITTSNVPFTDTGDNSYIIINCILSGYGPGTNAVDTSNIKAVYSGEGGANLHVGYINTSGQSVSLTLNKSKLTDIVTEL